MTAKISTLILASASLLAGIPRAAVAADQPSLTLPDILSRHLQAMGTSQKQSGPKTERVTGTVEAGGLHGTYVTISAEHGRYWSEEKLGISDEVSGSDGKVTWRRDSNGTVRLLAPEELKNERNDQYIDTASYAVTNRLAGKVTLRPEVEKRSGNYVLDVEAVGGKPSILFIDPKTFLLVKEQHEDDDRTITTTFSDFKPFNGVLSGTTRRISNGDRKYDEVYTITGDQDGVDAPDSLFAMPPDARNYEWVHKEASSAVIPFDSADHSINLFVGINGEPAYIILDSGAGDLAISTRAANYLKLPHQGNMEARGYGGSTSIYPIKLDAFEIPDGVVFHNITASAVDMHDDYDFGASTPSVGLMGYAMLAHMIVQVDYRAEHITLSDPDTWKPSASDGVALPMELNDNVPSVEAQFDGLPAARFLVDTGDSGCVRLYTPFVAKHKIAEKYPKGMDDWGMGIGGLAKARRVRGGSFAVAGVTLKNVPTDLALDAKGGASQFLAGALGHEFLSRFTVTFDYPHRKIYFAPNTDTQKPFDTRTFGITAIRLPDPLVKDKTRIVVYLVDPSSPAHKAGLERADSITEIDGQSAAALGLGGVRRLLSPEGGKDTHELSIIGGAGGTGKVTVKLYDPMSRG